MIAQLRRFNRVVTAAAGALRDPYLGGKRPFGEARLLWEIGIDGGEVRRLRARLGLDSGYLSRLLRSLAADGLITVAPSSRDRRIRVAHLTSAGRRECALLDGRSNELARSLVSALGAHQQERLAAAMNEVERLLTAATVEILLVDPEHRDARYCLAEYVAELNRRSERGFDPSVGATALPQEVRPPAGEFFVAYLRGEPIGCGAVKHHGNAPAELKRMWIAPSARGLGLGRRLLAHLEARACGAGARVAHLETSAVLAEALALYRSAGWVEVAAYNDEPFADYWFEKRLVGPVRPGQTQLRMGATATP